MGRWSGDGDTMDHQRQSTSGALVQAPGKVNVFLEVLSKRPDGYHEIQTLLVAVSLYDTLWITRAATAGCQVACQWAWGYQAQRHTQQGLGLWPDLPRGQDNLVHRAVEQLHRVAEVPGVRIGIYKRVPSAAGLGGASSDAASALGAIVRMFSLPVSGSQLSQVGASVGSDVPFFFARTAAVCRGRGEQVEPLPRTPNYHFVIVRPPVGLSTAEVYQRCRVGSPARDVQPAVEAFLSGDPVRLGKALFNRLQEPARQMSREVTFLERLMARCEFTGFQMSGSGSSFFGVCRHARHAQRAARYLRAMGAGAVWHVTTGLPPSLVACEPAEGDHYGNHRGSHQADGEKGCSPPGILFHHL
jgi:4-diphosphocytidyl-2-C-methyl-D-erythritol kinase